MQTYSWYGDTAEPNSVNSLFSSTINIQIYPLHIDIEKNGNLPFLNVFVSKKADGTLDHQVYRKSTHTDKIPTCLGASPSTKTVCNQFTCT